MRQLREPSADYAQAVSDAVKAMRIVVEVGGRLYDTANRYTEDVDQGDTSQEVKIEAFQFATDVAKDLVQAYATSLDLENLFIKATQRTNSENVRASAERKMKLFDRATNAQRMLFANEAGLRKVEE
jgi:hypothetical protein